MGSVQQLLNHGCSPFSNSPPPTPTSVSASSPTATCAPSMRCTKAATHPPSSVAFQQRREHEATPEWAAQAPWWAAQGYGCTRHTWRPGSRPGRHQPRRPVSTSLDTSSFGHARQHPLRSQRVSTCATAATACWPPAGPTRGRGGASHPLGPAASAATAITWYVATATSRSYVPQRPVVGRCQLRQLRSATATAIASEGTPRSGWAQSPSQRSFTRVGTRARIRPSFCPTACPTARRRTA